MFNINKKNKSFLYAGAAVIGVVILGLLFNFVFRSGAKNPAWKTEQENNGNSPVQNTQSEFSDWKEYRNTEYSFSLKYPSDLLIEIFDEGAGVQTILFQSQTERKGFQITISPFDQNAPPIFQEKDLREQFPSMPIEDIQEIILPNKVSALLFWSDVPEIGRSREVWFVHNSHLFAITTYAELDTLLARIMATFQFEN